MPNVTQVIPIHKATMLKQVRETGAFFGYIAPNMVNHYHIKGGWNLGCPVILTTDRQGNMHYVSPDYPIQSLDEFIREFSHYQCRAELGRRVRFWKDGYR